MRSFNLFAAAAELIAAVLESILAWFAGVLRAITGSQPALPLQTAVSDFAIEASAEDDKMEREAEERRKEREARRAAAALRRQEIPGHVRRALKAPLAPRRAPVVEEEPKHDLEPALGFRM